jgi:hypothetical protein
MSYRTPGRGRGTCNGPSAVTITGMRQIVSNIDGWRRQAGDRYSLSNQTPRPAAVVSEMGHLQTRARLQPLSALRGRKPMTMRPCVSGLH